MYALPAANRPVAPGSLPQGAVDQCFRQALAFYRLAFQLRNANPSRIQPFDADNLHIASQLHKLDAYSDDRCKLVVQGKQFFQLSLCLVERIASFIWRVPSTLILYRASSAAARTRSASLFAAALILTTEASSKAASTTYRLIRSASIGTQSYGHIFGLDCS